MGSGLGQGSGAVGWCYVCVRCESGFSVWMAGPGICVLCLADTCTSEVHPVFNPVAPYGYLLSDMFCLWQISQIQTFLFKVVGPGLVSTSPAFVSSSASHPAGPHGRHAQKTVNRAPIAGGGGVRHNLHSSLRPL